MLVRPGMFALLVSFLPPGCLAQTPQQTTPTRASDLAVFEEQFLDHDRSFRPVARAEAKRRLDALRSVAHTLDMAEFELALAEIAALSGNGHSQLLPARWANDFDRLAVRFLIVDDGLYVADAVPASGHDDLIGARVQHVEGATLDELREVWSRYATGREGFRDQSLYFLLEAPAMLRAAGVAAADDGLTLGLGDGRTVRVGLSDAWPAAEGIWRYLPPARQVELKAAGRVDGDPLYLQEPDAFFRLVDLPERDAVYMQFRANVDFAGEIDMAEAAAAALDHLRQVEPRYVIVDQRFNFGGDLNTTRTLMQGIPDVVREDGEVFAITSGRSFSAGITSLSFLEQAGGDRVTIIGAPVGDHLEFWAEGEPLTLESGAVFLRATERHNYMTGCPEPDCHASAARHDIRVATLEPDIRPELTYDDFVAGRDPYLEAAFALMNGAD